jgi:hypothetical protein
VGISQKAVSSRPLSQGNLELSSTQQLFLARSCKTSRNALPAMPNIQCDQSRNWLSSAVVIQTSYSVLVPWVSFDGDPTMEFHFLVAPSSLTHPHDFDLYVILRTRLTNTARSSTMVSRVGPVLSSKPACPFLLIDLALQW